MSAFHTHGCTRGDTLGFTPGFTRTQRRAPQVLPWVPPVGYAADPSWVFPGVHYLGVPPRGCNHPGVPIPHHAIPKVTWVFPGTPGEQMCVRMSVLGSSIVPVVVAATRPIRARRRRWKSRPTATTPCATRGMLCFDGRAGSEKVLRVRCWTHYSSRHNCSCDAGLCRGLNASKGGRVLDRALDFTCARLLWTASKFSRVRVTRNGAADCRVPVLRALSSGSDDAVLTWMGAASASQGQVVDS